MVDIALRLSRRATNFLYRYDSLRNNQLYDLEQALDVVEQLQVFSFLSTMSIANSIRIQLHNDNGTNLHSILNVIQEAILVELGWLVCLSELLLLEVEDTIYFSIHARPTPAARFPPIHHNRIDLFHDEDADEFFGYSVSNLHRLHLHWRIPISFTNQGGNGMHMNGEECFLLYLCFIRKGEPYTTMAQLRFGGDPRRFSFAIHAIVQHLYDTFYHKISGNSMQQWLPSIHAFRYAIWEKLVNGFIVEMEHGQPVHLVHVYTPVENFTIFGFLDDTGIQTAAPGRDAQRHNLFAPDVQRAFYSRYFRHHGLKVQTVLLPNGLFGSIYIASLRNNDNGILNMSQLGSYLQDMFRDNNMILPGGHLPAVYADGIFARLPCVVPRHRNTHDVQWQRINTRMASLRESIEHVYAHHSNLCRGLHQWERLRLYRTGEDTTKLVFSSFLYWNSMQCIYQTFNEFNVRPPSLEEYLPLHVDLEGPPHLFEGIH